MSDIDIAAVDSLKLLDPKRPIREADIAADRPTLPLQVVSDVLGISGQSALPRYRPKADMSGCAMPIADIAAAIRSPRRRGRAATAARSRPSALAVLRLITSLVLGRRLHRQVGRLLALEDAVDVAGRAPVLVDEIRPIGDQAAGGDEDAFEVDRRQLVPGRQRDDQIAMNASQPRSPSRSGRHSGSARRPRRRARSRRRRAC